MDNTIRVFRGTAMDGGCQACHSTMSVNVIRANGIEARFCNSCLRKINEQVSRIEESLRKKR